MTAAVCSADAVAPTPDGFRKLADLGAGDQVFGSCGGPVRVAAVGDAGQTPRLALTFSDGAQADAGEQHLCQARDGATGTEGPYRSTDIAAHLNLPDGSPRWSVPLAAPIEFSQRGAVPVDPFTFGEELRAGLVDSEAELMVYLTAAIPVRREVLRGLLADRRALPASAPATATAALASLLRSLGGVPHFERAGFGWRIAARYGGRRDIVAAELLGPSPLRTLTVESSDGLYVTGGDFVLTSGGAS